MRNWLKLVGRRLRALVRGERLDAELTDEIRLHIELETEDLMRMHGLSRDEARRRAMIGFGGVERYREAQRDARGVRWIEQLAQDAKYAVRSLRKSPGFVVTSALTIALGIGVTTTMYSVVNRLILHPLPFANGDRWRVFGILIPAEGNLRASAMSQDMVDWAKRATTVDAVSIVFETGGVLSAPGHSTVASGADISPELLLQLGVKPTIGRVFGPADASQGAERTMVLSDHFWRAEFGGSRDVLGEHVTIHDTSYVIVGVVPDQLDAINDYSNTAFWAPLTPTQMALFTRQDWGVRGVARLKPKVTVERAEQELNLLKRQEVLAAGGKVSGVIPTRLVRPGDVMGTNLQVGLWVLVGATLLVLLITCANVASLHLVRAANRARELSVRAALGASRGRLVRQMSVEGLILAAFGGTAGIIFGYWMLRAVILLRPQQLRQLDVVQFDRWVLLVGIALAGLTSLAYGVLPAWHATSARFATLLRSVASTGLSRARSRLQSAVIVGELALSVVLLTGAGLLVTSFARMNAKDPGFAPDGLLEMGIVLPAPAFPDSVARTTFWSGLTIRADAAPDVAAAIPVGYSLLQSSSGWSGSALEIEGAPPGPKDQEFIYSVRRVPAAYFAILGIHVLAGRTFTPEDERGQDQNVVIGQEMARRFWPNGSAVGHRFRTYRANPWLTVEGVVSDVGLIGPSPVNRDLQFYYPTPRAGLDQAAGIMVRLRPGADVSRTLAVLRSIVKSVNPRAVITDARSERSILDDNLASPRFSTTLMIVFAALALVLAAVGLYGLIAYAVSQRTHEIGVRVALGAGAGDVVRMVLGDGVRLAVAGLILGLGAALAAARLLTTLLYGVSPTDPLVLVTIPIVLVATSLLASYLAARRAACVDPVIALRAE
ncbi:MAG: ADOP family duplicated permease [Gemmatimonadaceae bacterium]|nr:ADOP family duplicated permease [Gemmatimonadaceae bacterium]